MLTCLWGNVDRSLLPGKQFPNLVGSTPAALLGALLGISNPLRQRDCALSTQADDL
jgi:hypothetical protein